MSMRHSIYFHIPFCMHRCAYCDFNTYADQGKYLAAYVVALRREIEYLGERAPIDLTAHTIFFGGGTPSLLSHSQVRGVLRALRGAIAVEEGVEITLEANPGTLSEPALQGMREAGVNRLSLGVQSANGEELRLLERTHSFLDVLNAVTMARRAGFDNLNMDLIFGLPGQSMWAWQETVKRVLAVRPEHISAYALTLEHGTPFGQWSKRGLMVEPDADLAADMYEWLSDVLASQGYAQYEISNWALRGRECVHNLQYWRGQPYLGLGAGAHGYAGGYRYSNALGIRDYIERLGGPVPDQRSGNIAVAPSTMKLTETQSAFPCSPASVNFHRQTTNDDMSEFMIMGLRLTREGISAREFLNRFGVVLDERFGNPLAGLERLGLIERARTEGLPEAAHKRAGGAASEIVVRLTPRGRLLGNRVFAEFVEPAA
ncbi:MAG TPA: radical SAM family heme chaperone HemW [Anaerolineales bacterium]